jgi:CYTH domain-containing protein
VGVSLKYAVVERERRFIVARVPEGVVAVTQIVDRYLDGTRLRLREIIDGNGVVTRKLGHKVRLTSGPQEVACTSMYLDDAEWELLRRLSARTLRKTRHIIERDGVRLAVDEFEDGTLLAEIDYGKSPEQAVPIWLEVITEVTADERWTGAHLANRFWAAVQQ